MVVKFFKRYNYLIYELGLQI